MALTEVVYSLLLLLLYCGLIHLAHIQVSATEPACQHVNRTVVILLKSQSRSFQMLGPLSTPGLGQIKNIYLAWNWVRDLAHCASSRRSEGRIQKNTK